MKFIFNVFFFQMIFMAVKAQDSLLELKLNPFLIGYLSKTEVRYPITFEPQKLIQIPDYEPLVYRTNGQELICTEKNTYILIASTGRLYKAVHKTDSIYYFKRIDKTVSVYFNIGSYEFTIGEDIYSYGGYGFWKTNGVLRKYNFKDQEWDAVTMQREVIAQFYPSPILWFDYATNELYVPVQREHNDAIRVPNKELTDIKPEYNVLDVQKQIWTKKGEVTKEFIDFTQKLLAPIKSIHFSGGELYNVHGSVYYLNYRGNKILQSNDVEIQSLSRLSGINYVSYIKRDTLYAFNTASQKLDTLLLNNIAYKNYSEILEDDQADLIYISGISILIFATIFFFKSYRKRPVVQVSSEENSNLASTSKKLFTETEISLIQLCIKRMKEGKYVDINEINHVLGVKNKNKGLQKKVRSEVINSVNGKFKTIYSSDKSLIESIRNQEDKRYFDYFIREEHFDILESH